MMIWITDTEPGARKLLAEEEHAGDAAVITAKICDTSYEPPRRWTWRTSHPSAAEAVTHLNRIAAGQGNYRHVTFKSIEIGPAFDLLRNRVH